MNKNFEDFIEINYRKLIKKAKKNYQFILYEEVKLKSSFVLWRHDVDISMHRALRLAEIEHEEGVKSTYFLQLSSSYYNIFENEIKNLVFEILKLGHQIGVHFDPTIYTINTPEDFKSFLTFEKKILEKLFNVEIKSFSFHNPLQEHLELGTYEIAGMVNTYSYFLQKNIEYCSDSCGYWRHKILEDFLEQGYKNIQVLTHPEWWQKEVLSPRDRIHKCIDGRALNNKVMYDEGLAKLGRLNVK
jgi:hypothetical protein